LPHFATFCSEQLHFHLREYIAALNVRAKEQE